jgi:hypothetical protein
VPSVTFGADGPLVVVNVHLSSMTVQDVLVTELGDGIVPVDLGDLEIGVRIVGPLAVVHAQIVDTDQLLTRLRRIARAVRSDAASRCRTGRGGPPFDLIWNVGLFGSGTKLISDLER